MRNSPSQRSHNNQLIPPSKGPLTRATASAYSTLTYSSTLLFEKGELGEKSLSLKLQKNGYLLKGRSCRKEEWGLFL